MKNSVSVTTTLNATDMATVAKFMENNDVKLTFSGIASFAVTLCAEWCRTTHGIDIETLEAWKILDAVMPKAASKKNAMRRLISSVGVDNPGMAEIMMARAGGRELSDETQQAVDFAHRVAHPSEKVAELIAEKYSIRLHDYLAGAVAMEPAEVVHAIHELCRVNNVEHISEIEPLCGFVIGQLTTAYAEASKALPVDEARSEFEQPQGGV